ncbi:hypothetical protein Pelo_15323 [Pelomyxa schiedti]|nr:hypothetical protein Pelo_15323 [Pelomyxa schiedti]
MFPLLGSSPAPFSTDDLGKGVALDRDQAHFKKPYVFPKGAARTVTSVPPEVLILRHIREERDLLLALCVPQELQLAYGLYTGMNLEDFVSKSTHNKESLSLFFSHRTVSQTWEIPAQTTAMAGALGVSSDAEAFRNKYGLHHIRKVHLGGLLDIKICFESTDKASIEQLKTLFSGGISLQNLRTLHLPVGCTLRCSLSAQGLTGSLMETSEANSMANLLPLIDSYAVDEENPVPVAIEVAPTLCNPALQALTSTFTLWLKEHGDNLWRTAHLRNVLGPIRKELSAPQFSSDPGASELLVCVQNAISKLETIEHQLRQTVSGGSTPINFAGLSQQVNSLTPSCETKTARGTWRGSVVNNLPVYQGVYTYSTNDVYTGCCIDGERNGQGELIYRSQSELMSIKGTWKDDNVHCPAVVTFRDGTPQRLIKTEAEAAQWHQEEKALMVKGSLKTEPKAIINGIHTIRLVVDLSKIHDDAFLTWLDGCSQRFRQDPKSFNMLFMGITGSGKTTLVEYLLNILTGQVHASKSFRAEEFESASVSGSKTSHVCKYDIEYRTSDLKLKFLISLLDTPGFADTRGKDTDAINMQCILETVSKLGHINTIFYVVNGGLTRKTLDPMRALSEQAVGALDVLNDMLRGIADSPSFFLNNPWSQHLNNRFRQNSGTHHVQGVDRNQNTKDVEDSTKFLRGFIAQRIGANASFSPSGMGKLAELKKSLYALLATVSETVRKLNATKGMLDTLKSTKVDEYVACARNMGIEQWCQQNGYAFIGGHAMAKVVGSGTFPGGVHATVCLAPNCTNMVCHEGCSITFTPTKGHNNFRGCDAFTGERCHVCPGGCSFSQHVHVAHPLEWSQYDRILETFNNLQAKVSDTRAEISRLESEVTEYSVKYDENIAKLATLREEFRNLAVLGDISVVLETERRTIEQQRDLYNTIRRVEEAQKLTQIVDQLRSFEEAIKEASPTCNASLLHQVQMAFATSRQILSSVLPHLL